MRRDWDVLALANPLMRFGAGGATSLPIESTATL
jgi:hypothetical protein